MFLFALFACVGGGGDDTAPMPSTCEEIEAAFAAEKAEIQSCESASECGQQLVGTSCGCTRDLVARTDADTTQFFALIAQANQNECDVGLVSTCDCPEVDGYDCIDHVCTWNYTQ